MSVRFSIFLFLTLFLLTPLNAAAYVDPGTGSLILQLILAGIAGAGLVLKLFWRRITGFFGKKPKESEPTED